MRAVLAGLLMIVGTVAVLNLLLTVGVIRRLRQHTKQLSTFGSFTGPADSIMLEAGERIGDFATTTIEGEPISRDLLSGQTLVGVFTPGCGACEERLPDFIERAGNFPGGREQVLAVVAGEPGEVEEYRDRLSRAARVVIEPSTKGPIVTALKVQGFPAFGLLDSEGVLAAGALALDELPLVTPTAA